MRITLQLVSGLGATGVREFDAPVIRIGRGDWNDLVFNDPSQRMVSRNHAEIRIENDVLTVVDLQSSFGTYVNGEKVATRVLSPNDILQLGMGGPELRISWEVQPARPLDAGRTVLGTPAETVLFDGRTGPHTVETPQVPPQPARPGGQPTVVVDTAAKQAPLSAPGVGAAGRPQPTVVVDRDLERARQQAAVPPAGRGAETVVVGSAPGPSVPSRGAAKAPAGAGRGVGKETMAFLIDDAIRKERERQGLSESGAQGQQAQMAIQSISKMKVLIIGAGALMLVILLAVIVQNLQLQRKLSDQESKISKADQVSVEMLKQMGKSEEEIKKARQEAEEATRKKIQETEQRFQSILAEKDREYRAQMDDLKKKSAALEALNAKVARDRQETVAVNKQVAASSEAAVVLIYCQYTLSNQENYDSHGTGFIVSPDGKVITTKQVVEPWKFDPDISAFMKVADLSLVKRDVYVWRLDGKVRQNADNLNLSVALSSASGSLSVLKLPPDEMESQSYTREDTQEKINIKIHKALSDNNLALLQIKGSNLPSVRANTTAAGAEVAAGATVMLYGYPLGVEQTVAKPELLRASLVQYGKVIKIDKPITRGYKGAPLLLPDGSVIGVILSEEYTIPIRSVLKLIG